MSKKTIKNLIIAVSIFVVMGVVAALSFIHVLGSSQELEDQIRAVALNSEQEEAARRLQRISQDTEAERAELASYFLLREPDSILFLSDVESLAPAVNVALEITGISTVTADEKDWVQVSLAVEGQKANILTFLHALEHIPYVSRTMSAQLSGEGTSQWSATITVQVQLLSYD